MLIRLTALEAGGNACHSFGVINNSGVLIATSEHLSEIYLRRRSLKFSSFLSINGNCCTLLDNLSQSNPEVNFIIACDFSSYKFHSLLFFPSPTFDFFGVEMQAKNCFSNRTERERKTNFHSRIVIFPSLL